MKRIGILATVLALMLFLVSAVSATVTITGVTPATVNENTAYAGSIVATPDPNPLKPILSYGIQSGPAWLTVNTATGALSGTPTVPGPYQITVSATDADGTVTNGPYTITVIEIANDAPVITSSCATDAVEDSDYTCAVTATNEETGQSLTYSLTANPSGMTINSATGAITWSSTEDDISDNDVTVKVEDNGIPAASSTQSFSVFVRPESICGDYTNGSIVRISDLDITDDDEDFYPGSDIEMDVEVENTGNDDLEDMIVEATLYDITDGKKIESIESDTFDLNEDDTENVELILAIPADIDVDNNFIVFISVYEDGNDDENCDWTPRDDLSYKRNKHDIDISKVSVSPSSAKTGETIDVKVDVENIGDRDEENVYVKVKNGELGIDKKSDAFDIDAYESGDDDEYTVTITFQIPGTAQADDYQLEVNVYDEDDTVYDSGEAFVTLTVEGAGAASTTTSTTEGSATVSVDGAPQDVEIGKAFSIPVQLTNTAIGTKNYKITVSNIADWADSTSEFEAYLTEGQSSTYYITVTPKKDAASGKHSVTINVKEGTELVASKTLSFTIPEKATSEITGGTVVDTTGTEEEPQAFKLSGTTLWIIGDIVLVIVAIVFIKMLFFGKKD